MALKNRSILLSIQSINSELSEKANPSPMFEFEKGRKIGVQHGIVAKSSIPLLLDREVMAAPQIHNASLSSSSSSKSFYGHGSQIDESPRRGVELINFTSKYNK